MTDHPKLPTLRNALWLYLLVLIISAGVIIGLSGNIDIAFLRLTTSLLVFGGFTIATLLITNVPFGAVLGRRPPFITIPLSFIAGMIVWIPATWLLFVVEQILGGVFGNLNQSSVSTVSPSQLLLSFGVIFPLCQGFLMFGYVLTAAQGIGRWRAIWLTALLFGLFGQFTTNFGLGAILAYVLIGFVGSVLVLRSGSVWPGILLLSGFNLADPTIPNLLLTTLLNNGQFQDLLSLAWLTTLLVSTFLLFALAQITLVARTRSAADQSPDRVAAPPGRVWWLPLIGVVILFLVFGFGEINTRRSSLTAVPPANTGITAPPLAFPTSVATQAANQ